MDANNELLQAIGQMMDSKLAAALEPINTRLDTIEGKQDKLSADIAHLNHELVPKVKVIYEGYAGQRDKLPRLDVVEGRIDKLEDDIFAVKERLKAQ